MKCKPNKQNCQPKLVQGNFSFIGVFDIIQIISKDSSDRTENNQSMSHDLGQLPLIFAAVSNVWTRKLWPMV